MSRFLFCTRWNMDPLLGYMCSALTGIVWKPQSSRAVHVTFPLIEIAFCTDAIFRNKEGRKPDCVYCLGFRLPNKRPQWCLGRMKYAQRERNVVVNWYNQKRNICGCKECLREAINNKSCLSCVKLPLLVNEEEDLLYKQPFCHKTSRYIKRTRLRSMVSN